MASESAGPRSGLSRRTLLRGGGVVAFGGLSLAALQLPLFSVQGAKQVPANCRATDMSESEMKVIISNWPAYIDPRKKETSTASVFTQQTGIEVDYTDDINDNAEFFAKVKNQLGSCQTINRDMIIMTDWMAARMVGLGWIQPLDPKSIPNVHDNLINPLRNRQWDKDLTYHAPWQAGLTGIAYNAAEIPEVRSFEELLTRADLKGRMTLLSEMRDTMAFMLRVVGADPDQFTDAQWSQALDRLSEVVASGQVRSFTGNEYIQDLAAGNIVACEAWSGDVIQLQYDNPDIKFVTPEEGLSLWADNMMVPNLATHQANAEAWMNYYYEPEVAAKLAAWVNYICPVKGAKEEMEKIDPSLVDNKLIFPDEEELKDSFDFMPLTDQQSQQYEGDFNNVIAG